MKETRRFWTGAAAAGFVTAAALALPQTAGAQQTDWYGRGYGAPYAGDRYGNARPYRYDRWNDRYAEGWGYGTRPGWRDDGERRAERRERYYDRMEERSDEADSGWFDRGYGDRRERYYDRMERRSDRRDPGWF